MVDFKKMVDHSKLRKEIEQAINKHSLENGSDTPDYIFTIPIQHFKISSLEDLKPSKFEEMIKRQEDYKKLHISHVSDSKFELIGSDMDKILDAINFINKEYKVAKLKPMDWSLLVSDNYSIFVEFELEGDENKHIRFINDLLSENNFKCKLYKTK